MSTEKTTYNVATVRADLLRAIARAEAGERVGYVGGDDVAADDLQAMYDSILGLEGTDDLVGPTYGWPADSCPLIVEITDDDGYSAYRVAIGRIGG